MVNTAIADFTDGVTAEATDRIAAARSPFGLGDDRWISPQYIKDYLLALASSFSANGAASTPPVSLTGTWFTGGSSTTTKPQFLVQPTGTTSTGWTTSGTGIGVNAASGFTGNLIDAQLNGVSKFSVASTGAVTSASSITSGATISGATGKISSVGNEINLNFYQSGIGVSSSGQFTWSSAANTASGVDTRLTRVAAGIAKIDNGSTGAGCLLLNPVAVASLPLAATAGSSALAMVNDATATTPRSTVAGGGSNKVLVMSDGTNWIIV